MRMLSRVILALAAGVSAAVASAGVAEWRIRTTHPASAPSPTEKRPDDADAAVARLPAEKNELPDQVSAVLEHSDRYELIALDPHPARGSTTDAASQPAALHGFRIIGSVEVSEKAAQSNLTGALKKSMQEWPHMYSLCQFQPRHAIRATKGADTIEVLICFHCGDLQSYVNGKSTGYRHVNMETPPFFDAVLTAAEIPYDKDGR